MARKALSVLVLLTAALLPAPSAAQEPSGVTVKQDGDAVVLIPKDPGKTYLVLGYPRDGESKDFPAQLSSLTGEQRLAAKHFSKLVVYELRPVEEILGLGSVGQRVQNPCKSGECDKPFPLGCPPRCPFMAVYLLQHPDAIRQIPEPKGPPRLE